MLWTTESREHISNYIRIPNMTCTILVVNHVFLQGIDVQGL